MAAPQSCAARNQSLRAGTHGERARRFSDFGGHPHILDARLSRRPAIARHVPS